MRPRHGNDGYFTIQSVCYEGEIMPFVQLNPAIPIEVVENESGIPTGKGLAVGVIDYSAEMHLMWVVFLDESGQCWTVQNPYIRAQANLTIGRRSRKKL